MDELVARVGKLDAASARSSAERAPGPAPTWSTRAGALRAPSSSASVRCARALSFSRFFADADFDAPVLKQESSCWHSAY